MQIGNEQAIGLVRQAFEALQQGRPAEARTCLERLTETGRANAQIWLMLATACGAERDSAGEEAAVDGLLAVEPQFVRGQLLKADCRAKAGDDRSALQFYESALLNAARQEVPAELAPDLRRAKIVVAQWRARADTRRETTLAAHGLPPQDRSPRFQQSLDILAGRKEIFVQQPTAYFFPGLPQTQFFDRADFDWVASIESETDAIRAELNALLADGREGFRPYLHHDRNRPRAGDRQLLDSPDWSALFLCENGRRNEAAIARCPRTWEAVQAAPGPTMANSPTILFSLLRPGARIAPHAGMFNTRLVCDLPLVVPPGCGFRVGNEVRAWEEGRLLLFDDTIEHEAWNDSDQDRVVLIFDIWRPDLSARERTEIAALFSEWAPQ